MSPDEWYATVFGLSWKGASRRLVLLLIRPARQWLTRTLSGFNSIYWPRRDTAWTAGDHGSASRYYQCRKRDVQAGRMDQRYQADCACMEQADSCCISVSEIWSSEKDHFVYVKGKDGNGVYLCLYIDELIIASKKSKKAWNMTATLKDSFKMKLLRKAKFFLVWIPIMTARQHADGSMNRYIDDGMSRFNQKGTHMQWIIDVNRALCI